LRSSATGARSTPWSRWASGYWARSTSRLGRQGRGGRRAGQRGGLGNWRRRPCVLARLCSNVRGRACLRSTRPPACYSSAAASNNQCAAHPP
jgi:hypothetical protein